MRSYEKAKEYVRKLNIKNVTKWREYCASGFKPDDIPSTPNKTYKNKGWINYGDFLGTNKFKGNQFLSFEEARTFARSLNLNNWKQWWKYCKNRPSNIPSAPNLYYKDKGWISWSDFLGTQNKNSKSIKFLSFEEAKKVCNKHNIKSQNEYKDLVKFNKDLNIPSNPNRTYKKDWKGWTYWFNHEQ